MFYTYQKALQGKTFGVVFGSFAPLHQGHLDLIMRAKKENDGGCLVIVCGAQGDKGEPLMSHKKRYQCVREFFAEDDLVAVYAINDTELNINNVNPEQNPTTWACGWTKWLQEFESICNLNGTKGTPVWYVGDTIYYKDLRERGYIVNLVDRQATNPITGTMIRNNPIKYWDKIAKSFRKLFSYNVLITGTASEGKSTLVRDLGNYFSAPYSYEWAHGYMKEYCLSDWELGTTDFLAFIEGQHNLNRTLINSNSNRGVFFADTDSLVTNMYAKYYAQEQGFVITSSEYEKVKTVAYTYATRSRWDKIFLLAPHGLFIDDHKRFMQHAELDKRKDLYDILVESIKDVGDWDKVTVLNGSYYENFMTIVKHVREVVGNG